MLRSSGMSLLEVSRRVGVAKSTASLWLREVSLKPEQTQELRKRNYSPGELSHQRSVQRSLQWIHEAEEAWPALSCDPLFIIGVGLYWGEGTKTGRVLAMSNSDPSVVEVWMRWCRRMLPRDVLFSGSVFTHMDVDADVALSYWKRVAGFNDIKIVRCLPRSSTGKRPRRTLPHGTLQVRLRRGAAEWNTKMLTWIRLAGLIK